MDKDTSFLFSGINFNRKRFANDFSRFKEKKEDEEIEVKNLSESPSEKVEDVKISSKKRKRKGKASELVVGFNVFKSSTSKDTIQDNDQAQNDDPEWKKEKHRQMEKDAIFRKKHNIHVSGSNVPSPFQSFSELKSRYNCKRYLLRNFDELGYKEPTPIQRQAMPVLLSGRECFACAPTGSGKTMAFVCPMLMKLQNASKDGVRAVIICPTRELAAQTARECKKLTKGKKFYIKLMTCKKITW